MPVKREKGCTNLIHGVEMCSPSNRGEGGGEWWEVRLDGGWSGHSVEIFGLDSYLRHRENSVV